MNPDGSVYTASDESSVSACFSILGACVSGVGLIMALHEKGSPCIQREREFKGWKTCMKGPDHRSLAGMGERVLENGALRGLGGLLLSLSRTAGKPQMVFTAELP